MSDKKKSIYMLYDWTDECIKLLTYDETKIFAKIGRDTLAGEIIDNYKVIEFNLDEVDDEI